LGIWTRRQIDERSGREDSGEPRLKKQLGRTSLLLIGIASIVGAGIFVLTGTAAAQYAGPGIVISLVFAGAACLCAALCYAEFASIIPESGGAYHYAYATLGELTAWIIGWMLVLEYLFSASVIAIGWSGYFTAFLHNLGIDVPSGWAHSTLVPSATGGLELSGAIINAPAAGITLLLSTLLLCGIRESAIVSNILVILKIGVVVLVIAFGMGYVDPGNWVPLIPENTGAFGEYGWSGVMRGAGVVFYAYLGFDIVSSSIQEARDPQRDAPVAIVGSLLVCTALYILMALVMTGLAPYRQLNVPHPIYVAIEAGGAPLAWLKPIVSLGAIIGLASCALMGLYAQSRIFFAMSRDGLLPRFFSWLHPRYCTPWWSTAVVGLVAALLAGLLPIHLLGELISLGTLLAFSVVCAGVWVLRRRDPARPRPFRTPLFPWVPLGGILCCGYLMLSLPLSTWIRLGFWLALGLSIYFLYGRSHSRLSGTQCAGPGDEVSEKNIAACSNITQFR
jgi:APA family basic amino acid/polyamine antiporter